MTRELHGAVVVITGASSGIGRATALALAGERSKVVLAARDRSALEDVALRCRGLGAEAIAIPTDVRAEGQVQRLADEAVATFGRIDVWVNCAGVIAYGRFEDIPSEVFRGVIETNLLGQVNGARSALRHFRRQDDGTLINIASVWARLTTPQVSSYVTSKFALRAFGECLRQELADSPRIRVATILPEAVDTPIFAHAANFSGRGVRPIPPLLGPDTVARAIVRCARDPAREATVGRLARMLALLHCVAPRLHDRTVARGFEAGSFGPRDATPGPGNVLRPHGAHAADGAWRRDHRRELVRSFVATAVTSLRGLLPARWTVSQRRGHG